MPITTTDAEYKRLRQYLTPFMRGPTTDAVLYALAEGYSSYLVNNVQYVNDSLYIATAQGNYLDLRLADYGITRPPGIGLGDDVFREIGIQVKNRKQVRDLIHNLLNAIFGDEFVKTTEDATAVEPYNLQDGDTLLVNYDDKGVATLKFSTSQFNSIAAATAQEVADAIVTNLRSQGLSGSAIVKNDGAGNYVELISDTVGPASTISVHGGRAQNALLFPSPMAGAGGNMSTQWTLSLRSGGVVRFTWTGGSDPKLGLVNAGGYVNIYGGGFASSPNEGSFTVTKAVGGTISNSYFEISNPIGSSGVIVQGSDSAIVFFSPVRKTLQSKSYYAAIYQTQQKVLQVFLPASTKVIRRERIGSAHLHDDSDGLQPNAPGPYIYDLTQNFVVGSIGTTLSQNLDGTMSKLFQVADSSKFPDSSGYLVFEYGSDNQEANVPYTARPSDNSLLISPAYTIQKRHASGTPVNIISQKSPIVLPRDGSSYQPYVTSVVAGREYAQELINQVSATGITVVVTILFPDDTGLGKAGTVYSDITEIWS